MPSESGRGWRRSAVAALALTLGLASASVATAQDYPGGRPPTGVQPANDSPPGGVIESGGTLGGGGAAVDGTATDVGGALFPSADVGADVGGLAFTGFELLAALALALILLGSGMAVRRAGRRRDTT
jgi:hypothetical protein